MGCSVFAGKIWISGGYDHYSKTDHASLNLKDVWSSSDGKTWELMGELPQSQYRIDHATVAFKDRLWLLGGAEESFDIWSTADGVSWTREGDNPLYPAGGFVSTAVFKDWLWVSGGKGPAKAGDNEFNYQLESIRYLK
jgi:hypothetical protein